MPRARAKPARAKPQRRHEPIVDLVEKVVSRVTVLERDVMELKTAMSEFRVVLRQVDDRTVRGEALMGYMQGEQRKQTQLLSMLVRHLISGVPISPLADSDPTPPAGTRIPDLADRPDQD